MSRSKRILTLLLILPHLAWAQSQVTGETSSQRLPTPAGSSGGSGGGINSNAGTGKASQLLGAGMNAATGYMLYQASEGCKQAMMCVMAALSFAQALMMLQSAKQSGNTQSASGVGGGDFSAPSLADFSYPGLDSSTATGLSPENSAAFTKLSEAGFRADANGFVRGPDGKIFKAEDFKNAQSMMAAGVPSGQASQLASALDRINASAKASIEGALDNAPRVISAEVDGGGGGYAGREPASNDGDDSFNDYLKSLANPFGQGNAKQMVAGKSVSHGDDNIGVRADDIFQMVHRKYQTKRAGSEFIENSNH